MSKVLIIPSHSRSARSIPEKVGDKLLTLPLLMAPLGHDTWRGHVHYRGGKDKPVEERIFVAILNWVADPNEKTHAAVREFYESEGSDFYEVAAKWTAEGVELKIKENNMVKCNKCGQHNELEDTEIEALEMGLALTCIHCGQAAITTASAEAPNLSKGDQLCLELYQMYQENNAYPLEHVQKMYQHGKELAEVPE